MNTDQLHQDVKDYYSQEVQHTSDLKFSACVCNSTKSQKHKDILAHVTFCAFKISKGKSAFESDVATHTGGIDEYEDKFPFDVQHEFIKNHSLPVSTKLLEVLKKSISLDLENILHSEKMKILVTSPKRRNFLTF